GRAVPASRDDAPGSHPAPRRARGGEPGGGAVARAREGALPQPGAAAGDLRPLDLQVREAAPQGPARPEAPPGRRRQGLTQTKEHVMSAANRSSFVYVIFIRTTPEKLWKALTDPQFTSAYWFGTTVESGWQKGAAARPGGPAR